jgi:hypothetical protein
MSLVPTTRTPLSLRDFAAAVLRNWGATGETTPPSERSVAVLYGQFVQETGGTNTWNWNVGNHKYGSSGDYMYLKGTWELVSQAEADKLVSSGTATLDTDKGHIASAQGVGKVSVVFQPPHRTTWFQAYSSLDEGMTAHLRSVRKKYGDRAWQSLLDGDPASFVRALKDKGYFTDNVNNYEAGVRRGYAEFLKSGAYASGPGSSPSPVPVVPGQTLSPAYAPAPIPWGFLAFTAALGAGVYLLARKGHRLPGLSKLRFT